MCSCIPDWIGIWKCWFLHGGENWSTRRKTFRSKGENQQQSQLTFGVDAGIWTWARWVGGKCSHHCATLAPLITVNQQENKHIMVVIKKCLFLAFTDWVTLNVGGQIFTTTRYWHNRYYIIDMANANLVYFDTCFKQGDASIFLSQWKCQCRTEEYCLLCRILE